jgi:hypothetical protein
VEEREYKELSGKSADEAVSTSLYLASHPAPPVPVFALVPQYLDAEKLADAIDEIFARSGYPEFESLSGGSGSGSSEEEFKEEFSPLTDAEAMQVCTEMKEQFHVIVGVSWGDLPFDLQNKWLANSCDYHLGDATIGEVGEGEGGGDAGEEASRGIY